ncbi:hypothetical protein IEQ34_014004 [Dendrobium chrysotoxum]|uniref:Protein kinase domain-containing protein n=1 Tax=Dendrobium chrysotoxum TaxID=161865 RepID=A0AAV7GJI9_DENCH|nr:hypothetical protein IEQ34_014004 [Dendrobium chrysotoxum]
MNRFILQEATTIPNNYKTPKSTAGFPVLQISAAVGASVAGITFALLLFFYIRKYYYNKRKKAGNKDADWPKVELRQYRLAELEKATNSFSGDRLLGSGAFGNVYKGVFNGGKITLAIKKAHLDSYQTVEEFRNEVELLHRVKHKNLVCLVGYCAEDGQRVLLYEYVSQGCLLEYLVGKGKRPLTWQQRIKIAIGSAKGDFHNKLVKTENHSHKIEVSLSIAHLHETQPNIIHRDVKPSNILIDDEFEAKVSDFGLVKLGPDGDASHVSTQVKGTPGYMDPAYCSSLHLTPSSDVYSFGVILLQLVTACPALDHMRPRSQYHISDWAKASIERGRLEEILDASLQLGPCNMKMILKMAQLGIKCTAWQPKDRPTMRQVVIELEAQIRAISSMQTSSDAEELQSISINNVQLQRFSVGSYDDLSIRSTSLRSLDVNGNSSSERSKLSGISEEMNGRQC